MSFNYLEWSDEQIDQALDSVASAIKGKTWPSDWIVPAAFFDEDNNPAFWCLDTEQGTESFETPEDAVLWVNAWGLPLPPVASVVNRLKYVRDHICEPVPTFEDPQEPCDYTVDVRLQMYDDGTWAVRSGDSSYDNDHRGFWGCDCVTGDDSDAALARIAANLIDQCGDCAAQAGFKVIEDGAK